MGALSQALQWARTPEKAERIATEALELAEQSGDPSALIAALAARAESLHGTANADARLPFIERLRELALASGDQKAVLLSHIRALTVHLERGDIATFEAQHKRHRQAFSETGLHQYLWYPGAYDTTLALMRGRLDEAETLAREYRALGGDNPDPNSVQVSLAHTLLLHFERAQPQMLLSAFELIANKQPHSPWPVALAWWETECLEFSKAGQTLQKIDVSDISDIGREPGGGAVLGFILEAAFAVGDQRLLPALYKELVPIAFHSATLGYGVGYLGSMARHAGLAAFAIGEIDEAIALLERACEHEKNRGAPSWQIYAEVDLSRVLRHAGASQHECRERLLPLRTLLEDFDLPRAHRKLEEALTLIETISK
jgi:tetratricopeptide (TPR) repeat protein